MRKIKRQTHKQRKRVRKSERLRDKRNIISRIETHTLRQRDKKEHRKTHTLSDR